MFERFEFRNTDFEDLPLQPDDFVYADPPYDVEFTSYSMGGFDWDAQQRAARWLSKHPGPVVLSNQRTDRIVELYKDLGFDIVGLTAPRLISCTGDRTPAKEVLATRNISMDRANAVRPFESVGRARTESVRRLSTCGRAFTLGLARGTVEISHPPLDGPVAQLGARLNGIQEVTGSIPVRSTIFKSLILNG